MCRYDIHAVRYRLFADDRQNDRLFSVHLVNLVSRLVGLVLIKRHKTRFLGFRFHKSRRFAFRLAGVQKRLVALAELVAFLYLRVGHAQIRILLLIKKLLLKFLCSSFGFLCHSNYLPFKKLYL